MGKPATSVPLHVVHRIDRATSGLLAFAKTKRAELGLAAQLRAHTMERMYICVAHGVVTPGGSNRSWSPIAATACAARRAMRGKASARSRTSRCARRCAARRSCEVRLETGKTHQIRIHLAESGHPLVGEPVYIRDYARHEPIASPRLLLHAATLGFTHPITGEPHFADLAAAAGLHRGRRPTLASDPRMSLAIRFAVPDDCADDPRRSFASSPSTRSLLHEVAADEACAARNAVRPPSPPPTC